MKLDTRARNPYYPDPFHLELVQPNTTCIIVEPKCGCVRRVEFGSAWAEVTNNSARRPCHTLLAITIDGNAVDLHECGISPYPKGWWSEVSFAIRDTEDCVNALHTWLQENGYKEAECSLCDLFPRLNELNESFWRRVEAYLASPA